MLDALRIVLATGQLTKDQICQDVNPAKAPAVCRQRASSAAHAMASLIARHGASGRGKARSPREGTVGGVETTRMVGARGVGPRLTRSSGIWIQRLYRGRILVTMGGAWPPLR